MTFAPVAGPMPEGSVEDAPFVVPQSVIDRSHHRLSLEAAAAYATHVDAARVRAATEGRTLVYTVRWI